MEYKTNTPLNEKISIFSTKLKDIQTLKTYSLFTQELTLCTRMPTFFGLMLTSMVKKSPCATSYHREEKEIIVERCRRRWRMKDEG